MKTIFPLLMCLLPAVAEEWHVGEGKTHKTVAAAIAAAVEGDTITVHSGIYQESGLKVDKSLKLTGRDWPVIDGRNNGEIITITAPGMEISGFEIRNSGVSSLEDLAGIKVSETRGVTVSNNRLTGCNFGIYMSKANDCRVVNNEVRGKKGGEQESGNGIHLWSCDNITVTGNHVRDHRDGIYLEFAKQSVIEHNTVRDNLRYGLHYMFSHDSAYRHNRFERNGAGVAVMYTRNVEMSSNHFVNNWGSSAYGLMLKDMTDGRITGNTFERNSIAIALHGSNRMEIENNRFSENGWAIQVQRSSSDNTYRKNNFDGNSFDIAADGELDNNRFEGNYWDKYEGYDLRRDGIGDVPFRPVSLYAVVVGRIPSSVLLLRSPVVHLLDQAEKAFPSITPERVVDEKPAMRPNPLTRPLTEPSKEP
ncbi:MAG: nitrous oxide reductase family maturation protein NosD [Akkermansiaceae bacterium]|jgi:nitrous oxidase accessory protein|nr:nitrous oxide reductase family maturation protein NosD [Akkermansiaceae bacterium]MCU0777777.1 nitrous oxide reductase family maturation protein NosD [Akkermansiaceae bacterium]